MRLTVVPCLMLLVICGCATRPSAPVADLPWTDPARAVLLAATAAPESVPGVFAIQVQGTGREGNILYLNSETDYRDPRNITAVILPEASAELSDRLGSAADVALAGKRILVRGEARRVKIFFTAGGRRTEKYYYQTHVAVSDANQIQMPALTDAQRFACLRQFEAAKSTLLANTAPYAVISAAGELSGDACTVLSLYAAPAGKNIYVMRRWVGEPNTPGKQTYADSRSCPRLRSVLREMERIPTPALPRPDALQVQAPALADSYRLWTNSARFDKARYQIEFSGNSIAPWLARTRVLDACWSEAAPASLSD